MKILSVLCAILLLCGSHVLGADQDSTANDGFNYPYRSLTIQPSIGINPYPMSDMFVGAVVEWNVSRRLVISSFTSYAYNNAFLRTFNHIKTDYNLSITQRFGVGTSLYSENYSHTISIMAGIRYDAFRETLQNPEFENVSASISVLNPDFGVMYNLKTGGKDYFFSYRMYLPLYPYPIKTSDVWSIDGNMANIGLEFGLGIIL